MFQPFEENAVIFIDTEFSDLDPYKGEVLSVGIVTLDGRELYIELEQPNEMSDWVKKNILKMLDGPKFSRREAVAQIGDFLGSSNPYAIAFVDNYDVLYLTKMFGVGQLPFKWMTVDFASILFGMGINPVKFQRDTNGAKDFYREIGIDTKKYRHHHALDDARLLRDVWIALLHKQGTDKVS